MALEKEVGVSKVVNAVLTYWVVSVSMVFLNKLLVGSSNDQSNASSPLFITWMQCIVCVLFVLAYSRIGAFLSPNVKVQSLDIGLCLSRPIMLVSLLFSAMLSANNYCLMYVGVAFFQIARSFTLIFTVLLSAVILHHHISYMLWISCVIVVLGFLVGVDQEKAAGTLSVTGVVFGMLSSMFVSLNGIYTKQALAVKDMDSVRLTLHTNANASMLLMVPTIFSGQVYTMLDSGLLYNYWFYGATLMSGVLAFLIAWASARQIEYTSPITHHVSNNAKSIFQAILAVIVFKDYKTALWWCGCLITLTGTFMYAVVKLKGERQQKLREITITASENKQGKR